MKPTKPAVFVSNRGFLDASGGGVQWCSREYLETIKLAGFEVDTFEFTIDRTVKSRLLRKFFPAPNSNLISARTRLELYERIDRSNATYCFLNNTIACGLAPWIRAHFPKTKIVFLSHGVELTDSVNNLRLTPELLPKHERKPAWLGRLIAREIELRRELSGTICISQNDEELEKWLGSRSTLFLPRQIPINKLPLQPIAGRIGCVSTLGHGPNLHGLKLLASALEKYPSVDLRIVGAPSEIGEQLSVSHPNLTYCGRLSDEDLKHEAASWSAFANPIFCPARGASTKVATALGWGLPVVTTAHGTRGYNWDDHFIPTFESPKAMAKALSGWASNQRSKDAEAAVKKLLSLAPTLDSVVVQLREFVEKLHENTTDS